MASSNPASAGDRLFAAMLWLLPTRAISRAAHALARARMPWLKQSLINAFMRLYPGIDMSEAAQPDPSAYSSFNAFFTRALTPEARPMPDDRERIVSPVDGTLGAFGDARSGMICQTKGMAYDLRTLVGGSEAWSAAFLGGRYATFYLAPSNYHRVHMPLNAELMEMVYVPGRLLSVNVRTADVVPGLFTRNERLICHFNGPVGPFSIVMISAMNVGNISTAWEGQVMPRLSRETARWAYPGAEPAVRLNKGQYLGQFNLGSTVIMIAGPGQLTWHQEVTPGSSVRMGQLIGELTTNPAIVEG